MLARFLYNCALTLSLPLLLIKLLYKVYNNPLYQDRVLERFGIFSTPSMPSCFWFHAVSVGESMAAAPLIEKIQQHYPQTFILVTTTTPSAAQWVHQNLSANITHSYLPYDYPPCIRRFVKHFNPSIAVIMETELWPNLMHTLGKARIPCILANARLSEQSFRGYRSISWLIRPMLQSIEHVMAQTQSSHHYFKQLGLCPNKLTLTKNIKFSPKIPDPKPNISQPLQRKINQHPCWIAVSTHPGEEEIILKAHHLLRSTTTIPNAKLILAPRHLERIPQIKEINRDFSYTTLSDTYSSEQADVIIVDTMGDLMHCFPLTQAAFIGGSLVPHGGHNLIEPLLHHIPVATGPHMHNFNEIWQDCQKEKLCKTIYSSEDLVEFLEQTLTQPCSVFAQSCEDFIAQQQEGLDQHMKVIQSVIGQIEPVLTN